MRFILLYIVFYTFLTPSTYAQNIPLSGLNMSHDIDLWYDSLAGIENTGLVLGILADTEIKAQGTHPYFIDFRWQKGSLVYRGEQLNNVALLYNLETDVLLTLGNGLTPAEQYIQLNSKQVSFFEINGAKFRRIVNQLPGHSNGFYEELYEGDHLQLITKHNKVLEINSNNEFEYVEKEKSFVKYKNQYHSVKNSRDLAHILKPYKKNIKSYAKQHDVKKLNGDTSESFIELVQYCNGLIDP
jgi:hypothetical protein